MTEPGTIVDIPKGMQLAQMESLEMISHPIEAGYWRITSIWRTKDNELLKFVFLKAQSADFVLDHTQTSFHSLFAPIITDTNLQLNFKLYPEPTEKGYYYHIIDVTPRVKMTLKEIERKLGLKIEIVK